MIQFFLFIFGASLGSFINVMSLRYDPEKSLWAVVGRPSTKNRSHCPHCKKTLQWYELIPITSFIIQLGRCRSCKKKLSWQYPVVEVLMGLLAVVLYTSVLTPPMCQPRCVTSEVLLGGLFYLSLLFLLSTLVTIALIDLRTTIIPDELIVVSLILVALLTLSSLLKPLSLFYGALIGGGFLSALWLLGQGRWMGLGDGKLGAVLGLWLGFPLVLNVLAISFITGSIVAIALLITRAKTMKDAIPFGPYLVFGGIVTFFLRQWLEGWWRLLGM